MHDLPRLAALATALPLYPLDQEAAVERARQLFAGAANLDRLLPVFANSGIRRRYASVPLDWFAEPHGWPERNRRYLATALDLLESATGRALDRAGMRSSEIGAIVVVSTTGIATPSLDALLVERMRLMHNVQRLPIFGLGCAGGVIGLARAATIAAAMPDKAVLLLVVELCSLTFRRGDRAKSNIVAAALFGDGTAAGDIPRLVADKLGAVAREFLGRHGLTLADIDRFVCHPGGPKVIDALEHAFGLGPGVLSDARAVLRDYGNMSAASVLFVLERTLEQRWKRALMTALGPGFTAGFVVLSQA